MHEPLIGIPATFATIVAIVSLLALVGRGAARLGRVAEADDDE